MSRDRTEEIMIVLNDLYYCYSKLDEVTEQEYDILITGQVAGLEGIVEKKQSLLDLILEKEVLRKKIINEIQTDFSLPSINNSKELVKYLSEHLENKNKESLEVIFNNLEEIVRNVHLKNERNQKMLKVQMKNLVEIEGNLRGKSDQCITYNSEGSLIEKT